MSKRVPKLQFTDEESQNKAEKKAAEKAEKKLPKKMLHEDVDKPKPSSKLTSGIKKAPINAVSSYAHKKVSENEDDNVGVESVHKAEQALEAAAKTAKTAERNRKLKPHRNASRFERKTDKPNTEAVHQMASEQDYQASSNPLSKYMQKQTIKKEYAKTKAASIESSGASPSSSIFSKTAQKGKELASRIKEFVLKHKKGALITGCVAVFALLIFGMLSSGAVLLESGVGGVGITTYPSSDEAMLQAEQSYSAYETNLKQILSGYESTHSYDEYHISSDEISHNPYVLISCLTAMKNGEWTAEEVETDIYMLFNKQYSFSENVVTEVRYREETRYKVEWYIDENGNPVPQILSYTQQVPYNYYICYVFVHNNNLSDVVSDVLTDEQYELYEMYNAFSGNRPDLFPDSE